MLGLLKSGDHFVAASSLFGSTVTLFSKICTRFGIEVTFVDLFALLATVVVNVIAHCSMLCTGVQYTSLRTVVFFLVAFACMW